MNILLEGFLAGLVLTMLVGPVFFKLIQTSMDKGLAVAAFMLAGIFIADLSWILLCISGLKTFINNPNFLFYSALVGGLVLIVFGTSNLLSKSTKIEEVAVDKKINYIKAFVKGFTLNGINPSVGLFWMAMASLAQTRYHNHPNEIIIFFGAMLCTIVSTDILKAYFASNLRKILNPNAINILNRLVGILMIVSGLFLIAKTYLKL